MTSAFEAHAQDQQELLYLYALQALPSNEAAALQAHIDACPCCRQELEALRPVIASFVAWPTDVLRPSPSLWERLAQRISGGNGGLPPGPNPWIEPEWEEVAPGVTCKVLAADTDNDRVSMLVRLAPGAQYPAHTHAGVEELHLLAGELSINSRRLRPGDYNRAQPGTSDERVWSGTGCTCVLITSTRDRLW